MAERTGARRDRGLERSWRRIVRDQQASPFTVRAFCEQHGLAESAFFYWRRELKRRDAEPRSVRAPRKSSRQTAAKDSPRFVSVVVGEALEPSEPASPSTMPTSPVRSGAVIDLVHPGGLVIRVPNGCDAAALRMILDVLNERVAESRPC